MKITFTLLFILLLSSCLSENERIVAANLENEMETNPYFSEEDYRIIEKGELFEYYAFPDMLVLLSELNSRSNIEEFYETFQYEIEMRSFDGPYVKDSDIPNEIKSNYLELKMLVVQNSNPVLDSLKKELELANQLRILMKETDPPRVGFSQIVEFEELKENTNFQIEIIYDTLLNVHDYKIIN